MIFSKKILIIAIVVIIIGLSVFFLFFNKKPETSQEDSSQNPSSQATKAEEIPLPVKAVPSRRGDLVIKLKSPGEAVTDRKAVIKAEVSGTVKTLNVEEGKHVRKGDLLVELNDKEYRLELERLEALRLKRFSELLLENQFAEPERELSVSEKERLDRAKREYEKAQHSYAKGLISSEEWEKAKKNYELVLIETGGKREEIRAADLTQTEVEVKKAQMELEKTKIRAPFSGIITDVRIYTQQHVGRGDELFTLVDISRIKVEARVLESEIGKMREGREVDLRFAAYPDRIFKGRVKAISPVVNPEDKTCRVIIEVDNPREEIKPGMHAEVEIAAEIHKDKLLIPQEAVLVRGGRKLVFVVEGDLAKWRYIEVGLENEEYAEVLEGIKEGEPVIVEGHFTLAHDARVRVVE